MTSSAAGSGCYNGGMSVLDRFGQVVKSEWNSRFRKDGDDDEAAAAAEAELAATAGAQPASSSTRMAPPPRAAVVTDVDGAMRILELQGHPGLDEVRARYRELSRRYHPKTCSDRPDDVAAAHVVLESLTEALELLEEHLLPLSP